ncbi:hypothetical protein G7Z17_g12572 [Cylindrodendrum hubeiense]|uniref:Uncharacterized protein n=1 Tax=Cylindrodendrum hubeiense TaxID=595255 RepID=A0A9P5H2S5_9HYPO|nr:hypothetical protein G7Z17_g12572 [Cylindrodendrum hubeiense]
MEGQEQKPMLSKSGFSHCLAKIQGGVISSAQTVLPNLFSHVSPPPTQRHGRKGASGAAAQQVTAQGEGETFGGLIDIIDTVVTVLHRQPGS